MSRTDTQFSLEPPIYFSYGQFFVYDRENELPGLRSEDQHYSQGFARRDPNVSFRTLVQHGFANVKVKLGSYEPAAEHVRVISVPFRVVSGVIAIDGPEQVNLTNRTIALAQGNYRLVAAQIYAAEAGRAERIQLLFERVGEPLQSSEIPLADDQLDPCLPLLERAEEP